MNDKKFIDDTAVKTMANRIVKIVDNCENDYDALDEVEIYLKSAIEEHADIHNKNIKEQ